MTEARIEEEIVAEIEWWMAPQEFRSGLVPEMKVIDLNSALRALIADWRAKKAEIERLQSVVSFNGRMGRVAAEAMRAKCEQEAEQRMELRGDSDLSIGSSDMAREIRDAIAALKAP